MAEIKTRIARLEQRFPEPNPFDELSHKELKALVDFLDEALSAIEQSREPSREVLGALEASGRDWDEWVGRATPFIRKKYPTLGDQ